MRPLFYAASVLTLMTIGANIYAGSVLVLDEWKDSVTISVHKSKVQRVYALLANTGEDGEESLDPLAISNKIEENNKYVQACTDRVSVLRTYITLLKECKKRCSDENSFLCEQSCNDSIERLGVDIITQNNISGGYRQEIDRLKELSSRNRGNADENNN